MRVRMLELWARLRGSWQSTASEELDEELRFHVDMATERNIARGLDPVAARREALLRFGGVERMREAAWDVQRSRPLEDAWRDVRHAWRLLRRSPAFATTALLTLALGIGANTAIFSVVDAVLLRPLPYERPAELVSFAPDRYERYEQWRSASTLTSSGAYTYALANVTGGSEPARVWTLAVTSTLLPTLGVQPLYGGNFTADDDVPNAPPRVLLRHGFWRTQFGGDPAIVGRTIELDGRAHEVIGVLPAELEFPPPARRTDGSMPTIADVWTGVGWLSDLYERGGFFAIGRLAPGASAASVAAELTTFVQRSASATANVPAVPVASVTESVLAPLRTALVVFTIGVGLVLLVACANLGSLLLARLTARRRELALRFSLGAARGRIVRQLLTEAGVLALLGALGGVFVAALLLRGLLSIAPSELARVDDASLNARVLLVTLVLAVVTALLVGLLPAWRALRRDPRAALAGARAVTIDRATGRLHGVLVASEIAFAIVLLTGAGLLLRSFRTLTEVHPGFVTDGLVTADVLVPPDRYAERPAVLEFFRQLEDRLAAQPGVTAVSAIDRLPYGRSFSQVRFEIAGRAADRTSDMPFAYNASARPGYFRTMGIPLLEGREFSSADATAAAPVVIIGRAVAERYWPGVSPIGARITVFGVEREIVGVAGDVRHLGPLTAVDPLLYLPQAQDAATRRMMTIVLRTSGSPRALLATLRREIRALDAQLPISNLRSFGALQAERTAGQRFNALLIGSFATLAVLLAAVGIYGVSSFVVAQRTREIGVRMALGATRSRVLGTFLRHALRQVAVGAAIGLLAAALLTRFMRSLLFGVTPEDPITYAGVLVLVTMLALVAAWLPARRAARVEPNVVLAGE